MTAAAKRIPVSKSTNCSETVMGNTVGNQKMDVGIIGICVAQFFPDCPVPIGQKTVSKSVKGSQNNPGKGCQAECDEVPSSPRLSKPSKKIEQDQTDVKDKEENVSNFIKRFHKTNLNEGDGISAEKYPQIEILHYATTTSPTFFIFIHEIVPA